MILNLFLTYGGSLKIWKDAGILDRELALYKQHAENGCRVNIISYGQGNEAAYLKGYDGISVYSNSLGIHPRAYAALLPLIHRVPLLSGNLYKTNQLYGVHIARWCKVLYDKPLVVRQGYGHYEHRVEEHGVQSKYAQQALRYERKAYQHADKIVFTTEELANRAIAVLASQK